MGRIVRVGRVPDHLRRSTSRGSSAGRPLLAAGAGCLIFAEVGARMALLLAALAIGLACVLSGATDAGSGAGGGGGVGGGLATTPTAVRGHVSLCTCMRMRDRGLLERSEVEREHCGSRG